ncbi:putative cobalt-precorrin-6A synthase (deacetylating) [Candidatus Terasakiella magnetica]|uniref:Cobalt-precorrin-5B C(1)-methyltransferase n=1 Tax=Candidatus Terasakiella magnetica TaxID=1867952 RepID=A0A1C3RLP3_9PROT|nr:cobalt-precorrin-5B (C(1))-methyltransferase [Candidatus Terasakiella magnetica]SCA58205.1 putative cobalt-precorrin-6A synthase (deacetylating) [Candidatus Terasakiella magnetica]
MSQNHYFVIMEKKELRKGWTTGACATAAAKAAFIALLTGDFPDPVEIRLPKGQTPSFALNRQGLGEGLAWAAVIKDAGDDPDITHGAEIVVSVQKGEKGSGICFKNGAGVGVVTKAGLPLEVGEPAINPMPRQMITDNLNDVEANPDVIVTVSITNGEELAQKTMNPRLGIIGGLSVLGTTGIVVPYSCSAWIHSIHRGIDVAKASGLTHVAATTGSTSEKAVCGVYEFEESALIDMGDFAGGVLKYIRKNPIEKLTLCGGFAKFCKLAQGEMDLHSSRSRVDFDQLSKWMGEAGAGEDLCEKTREANTALEVLELAQAHDIALADLVVKRTKEVAQAIVSGHCHIEVIAVNRRGEIVGHVS